MNKAVGVDGRLRFFFKKWDFGQSCDNTAGSSYRQFVFVGSDFADWLLVFDCSWEALRQGVAVRVCSVS